MCCENSRRKNMFDKHNTYCILLYRVTEPLSNEFSTLLCCRGPGFICDFPPNPNGPRDLVAGCFSKPQPHLGNHYCRTQPRAGQGELQDCPEESVETWLLRWLTRSRQAVCNNHSSWLHSQQLSPPKTFLWTLLEHHCNASLKVG